MKLQCQVEVINRLHSNLNIRSNGKYLLSTLVLGKEMRKDQEYFILHFSSVNKNGKKYKVKCMQKAFVKCMNEGKVTLRFEEPPHDLCIKSEFIQLKSFMRILKCCITGESKDLKLSELSSIGVTSKVIAPTKLRIHHRSEFPVNGFPRTLKCLYLNDLKLCNFRREILQLKHLTVLDISNNLIQKIPPEFGRLPNICELYLSNNSLGLNPDWQWLLGPEVSKKLKLLDLRENKIVNLPNDIGKLKKLVTLKIDKNSLYKLPTSLGRITTLRYLSVSENKLKMLPYSLMRCGLELLDVSTNSFTSEANGPTKPKHTPWDIGVNSLLHIAAKTVLNHKLFYAPNIIPKTLVELLDNSNVCFCGNSVLNYQYYAVKSVVLKGFGISRHIVFDCLTRDSAVNVEYFFCSPKCVIN